MRCLGIVCCCLCFALTGGFSVPTTAILTQDSAMMGIPNPLFSVGRNASQQATAAASTTLLSSFTSSDDNGNDASFIRNPFTLLGSLWGAGGALYILIQAFKITLASALEPIRQSGGATAALSPLQWSMYATAVAIFAHGQGHRCLQLKFAPLVVKRACSLDGRHVMNGTTSNIFLAPMYVMGLLYGTKKRLIKSYSLVVGTAALQIALQQGMIFNVSCASQAFFLSVLNAGFAAGFGWGVVSLAWLYIASIITGKTPTYNAGFPE